MPKCGAKSARATVEENRAKLTELDAEAADRLKPSDTTRIARALEVVLSTGRTLKRVAEKPRRWDR